MRLYLVQHAEALTAQEDPARPLSEQGRRRLQKVVSFIKGLNLRVDYLWHSDKLRAAQTAESLAKVINVEKTVSQRNDLGPNDDVKAIRDELVSGRGDIMIVGHLPFLSKLASLLLTGCESTDTAAFKNAGIVCLTCSEKNQWQIDWLITPHILV